MKNNIDMINSMEKMQEVGDSLLLDFVPKKLPQVLSAAATTIGCFALGTALGWSSPSIPNLVSRGDFGELSASEKSWIGGLVPLGAAFSSYVAGFLMQRIGRKWTMVLLGFPFVLGWILVAASQNLAMLLVGRFITGFSGGAFIFIGPVYIGEIAEDSIRGTLSTVAGVLLVAGILFTYIVGALVSWVWLSIICTAVPVMCTIALLFVPESPRYLLEKVKTKEAAAALQKLRGATSYEQITPEINMIEKSIHESNSRPANFVDLFEPSVLKPVAICVMLMVFQQCGGINAVIFYAVDIFKSAGSDMDPNVSSIIIGALPVLLVSISAFFVDRAGRKILFIISEIGMCIGLVALGIFFTLKANNNDVVPPNLGWLPLVSLMFYIITYNIAVGPLPWVVMGELLPPHIKGLAGALVSSTCWGLGFVITFTFADLLSALGPAGCYFLFGSLSFVGALFAIFVVPETKGKSLDEIQALFKKH